MTVESIGAAGGERWSPQPGSQVLFLSCPIYECLYEGTRGPGKTDALLMDFAQHVGMGWGPRWRGILFRQTHPQLSDVIAKTRRWFHQIFPEATFNEARSEWRWPSGEALLLRHMRKPEDYWNYHGHEYPWIGWEELTNWPDDRCYKSMMACSRSTAEGMPRKYRSTTNPYGVGHNWVKARFDLPAMRGRIIRTPGEPDRVALHGSLDENAILLRVEPDYKDKLRAAASNESQLKAWLEGSWDIVAGGMFDDVWRPRVHVLRPFEVPASWRVDRALDWGESKPFSIGIWATSDGTQYRDADGNFRSTVRGDTFRVREWYGWTGRPNEGTKSLAVDVAETLKEKIAEWGLAGRVKPGPADTSIFDDNNGRSIARDFARRGVRWERADKGSGSRKQGWQQMRKMLKQALPSESGHRDQPGLFVFEDCRQFIRTVPVLPRNDGDLDDVDTDAEDHVGDETRYRVRWRPRVGRGGDL